MNNNIYTIKWFLFFLILLCSFYPYEFQDSLFPILQSELVVKLLYIVLLFIILLLSRKAFIPNILKFLAGVHALGFFCSFMIHGGIPQYIGEYVTILFVVLLIVTIDLKVGIVRFFELYNKWILLMAIGGCVALLLAFMGVSPIGEFENSRDHRIAFSWIVSYTNVYYDNFIRYSGYFDEPGAMGYWIVFAIAINRLFIKEKKIEYALIVLGVFSFSFGFIIQVIAFLLLFVVSFKSSGRNLMLLVLATIIGVAIYSSKDTKYSSIYDASFGRYERMQEVDDVLGERRGELSELAKKYYERNPFWGLGRVQFAKIPYYMQDNPYETLAKDGIIGTVYLYFPFLLLFYWGLKKRDWELLRVWIFMVLSFMHRPFHPAPLYYFIFYSIVFMYYEKMKTRRLHNG